MKLLKVMYENIRRITMASVELPANGIVTISGPNESGKSTFLKAILWALRGKAAVENPDTVITEGERKGSIQLTVGKDASNPEYTIDLIFRKGGPVLKVEKVDKSELPMTQAQLLKSFWNDVAIDPLRFARSDAKTQRETLMKVIRFTTDETFSRLVGSSQGNSPVEKLDAAYAAAYSQRTEIGHDRKQAEMELISYAGINENVEDVDVKAVTDKRNALYRQQQERTQLASQLTICTQQISDLEQQIALLKVRSGEIISKLQMLPVIQDAEITALDELLLKAADAEKARTKRRLKDRYNLADAEYTQLTELLEAIKQYKTHMVETATMPIAGIGFDGEGGGVTFEGEPLEARGVSRNLKIGAAVAAALNPELRLILLDQGSELSDESVIELAQWAQGQDLQIVMAREMPITADGIVSFEIHDGAVVASKE